MKIIKPSFEILTDIDGDRILKNIERAGRVCYKSEDKITDISSNAFAKMICHTIKHHSVIEHESVSVRFVCNRGFSHELVRHRVASFSQESTRYCNYTKKKFGRELTVIRPDFESKFAGSKFALQMSAIKAWEDAMKFAETQYFKMIDGGAPAQIARGVLPIDIKTEIVITANVREWMHIFNLRCSPQAHPSMRELMIPLRDEFRKHIPIIFDEVKSEVDELKEHLDESSNTITNLEKIIKSLKKEGK